MMCDAFDATMLRVIWWSGDVIVACWTLIFAFDVVQRIVNHTTRGTEFVWLLSAFVFNRQERRDARKRIERERAELERAKGGA